MKIGPREQLILMAAVAVVAVIAVAALLVFPQIQQLGDLDGQISKARADLESAKGLLAVRAQSKDRAAATDAKWLRLADMMPESPDLPSFIVEAQDAAFASGVQLLSVAPAAPTGNTTYYAIPIEMQVAGTWADTVDYLERLIKINRGVRIIESNTARTSNDDLKDRENMRVPDYAVLTDIKIEIYMIPAATGSTSTTPAPAPTPTPAH